MDTLTVANRLIELCSKNEFLQAQDELYANDITRVETEGTIYTGKATMRQREENFLATLSAINHTYYSAPLVTGSYFTVTLTMDIEIKKVGKRHLDEICVYKVEGGKIVFEQFFRG